MQSKYANIIIFIFFVSCSEEWLTVVPPVQSIKMNGNEVFTSYRSSRRFLNQNIQIEPYTFYCDCRVYMQKTKNKERPVVDIDDCGFQNRSSKIENSYTALSREHIVPASRFGPDYCWNEKICKRSNGDLFGGRECCRDIDEKFRIMEADLINLRPAILSVNRDRRDFAFGEIPGENRQYGKCDFEIDFEKDIVEPREEIRGDIARTYFYFENIYKMQLTDSERELFLRWDLDDPVTEEEIKRNSILSAKQSRNQVE